MGTFGYFTSQERTDAARLSHSFLIFVCLCAAIPGACLASPPQEVTSQVPADETADPVKALFIKGFQAEKAGDNNAALEYFRKCAKDRPNSPDVLFHIAIVLNRLDGDKAERVASFKRFLNATAVDTDFSEQRIRAYEHLNKLLLPSLSPEQRKKYETAQAYLRAAKIVRTTYTPNGTRGDASFQLKRAFTQFTELTQEVPKFLPAYYLLGISYEWMEDGSNAYVAYKAYTPNGICTPQGTWCRLRTRDSETRRSTAPHDEDVPRTTLIVHRVVANSGNVSPVQCRTNYKPEFPAAHVSVFGQRLTLQSGKGVVRLSKPTTYRI
jgi:tetratricopeptide (TPR) repeat protein